MKKLQLLIAFIAFGTLVSFQPATEASEKEINWMTIEEAIELQKTAPKKIIMDVYTNWCGPCKRLDKFTFHNEDVVDYVNEHYYAVKFNAEGNSSVKFKDKTYTNPNYDETKANKRNSVHQFARFLKVRSYPTMIFFDEEAGYITPVIGYLKPRQLELYLKLFKNDKHKDMDTQEKFNEYYKSFKPTFKEE